MVEPAHAFVLRPELAEQIVTHALAGYPEEVCGLVSGKDGAPIAVYPGRNVSPTPSVAYELDAETLARVIEFEDAGQELFAIYHSHPDGPETPSETDIAQAFYPDAIYLICSLADPLRPVLRAFHLRYGRVTPAGDETV